MQVSRVQRIMETVLFPCRCVSTCDTCLVCLLATVRWGLVARLRLCMRLQQLPSVENGTNREMLEVRVGCVVGDDASLSSSSRTAVLYSCAFAVVCGSSVEVFVVYECASFKVPSYGDCCSCEVLPVLSRSYACEECESGALSGNECFKV